MLIFYIYLFILLLMVVLTVRILDISVRFSPIKIKVLSITVLFMVLLRIASLLIMFFSENAIFLHLLKPFVFLNFLYIPILTIICLYIFIRNDKINFSYFMAIACILAVAYIFIIYKVPVMIQSLPSYGYSMSISNNLYVLYGFIGLNTLTLIFCVVELGKPVVNNLGVFLVLLSSATCISDIFLSMLGVDYLIKNILGDFLFLFTMNYAVARLKK